VYRLPFRLLIRQRGYAPVGRLGVEPSDTAVSERPRRPAGSRPLGGRWRCRAPRPVRAAAGFQGPLPRRRRTFQSGARRCRSLRCYPPPAFGAGCSAGCARSMSYCAMNHLAQASLSSTRCPDGCGRGWQRTENSNPSAFAPTRFPARASRLAGSSSKRGRRAIRKPRGYPRIR
jgi:hypothetical protein